MLSEEQYNFLQQLYNVSEIPFLILSMDSEKVIAFPEHSECFFSRSYWLDETLQKIQNEHKDEIIVNNVGEFSNQIVVWLSDRLVLHSVPIRTSMQSPYHLYALIERGIPVESRSDFVRFLLDIPPKSSKQLCDFAAIAATYFTGSAPKGLYLASPGDDPKLNIIRQHTPDEWQIIEPSRNSMSLVTYYNNLTRAIREGNMTMLLDTLQSPVAGSKVWQSPGIIKDARYEFTNLLGIISMAAIDAGVPAATCIQMRKRFVIIMDTLTDIQKIIQYGYYCSCQFCEQVIQTHQQADVSPYTIQAKNYILDHLTDPIDTSSVSDALHVNKKTLNLYFNQDMNMSLYQYILDQRLKESCYMLENTTLSISYISEFFNFSSQSHFTKLFKEKYGTTPHRYRTKK